ncbi:flagellar protein FliT [Clostridium tertium]|uniref:Flagellar protein FliT n=1 Tax=Clostridium tertium TaxID=1559 RepID=A0A6N3ESS5_9CLOT
MINKILENYKEITENIILKLKNDLDVDDLMDNREKLIKDIFKDENMDINYIKEMYISMGIFDVDKELKSVIEDQQIKVRKEIRNLHNIKNANNAYGKNRKSNNFFNTKI